MDSGLMDGWLCKALWWENLLLFTYPTRKEEVEPKRKGKNKDWVWRRPRPGRGSQGGPHLQRGLARMLNVPAGKTTQLDRNQIMLIEAAQEVIVEEKAFH